MFFVSFFLLCPVSCRFCFCSASSVGVPSLVHMAESAGGWVRGNIITHADFTLFKRLILVMHIFMCVCACTRVCVHMHMSVGAHQSQKRVSSDPLLPSPGGSEPFNVGAKKSSMYPWPPWHLSSPQTHAYFKTGTLKVFQFLLRLEMSYSTFLAFVLLKARTFLPSSSFYIPSYPQKSKICIRVSFECSRAHGTFYTHSWSLSLFTLS